LRKEEPRSGSDCNDTCSLELGAIGSKVLRGMVMANMTEVAGTMDLAMTVSSAVATGHSGVINSIAVIRGFFGRSTRVGGRGCDGGFRVFFLLNEGGRRRCVGS
jgi:hypothetical protein